MRGGRRHESRVLFLQTISEEHANFRRQFMKEVCEDTPYRNFLRVALHGGDYDDIAQLLDVFVACRLCIHECKQFRGEDNNIQAMDENLRNGIKAVVSVAMNVKEFGKFRPTQLELRTIESSNETAKNIAQACTCVEFCVRMDKAQFKRVHHRNYFDCIDQENWKLCR